jgi:acyl-CoA thioester hydrolase
MEKVFYEDSVELTVLFNEVDVMTVVWHGHYFKYFEAARSSLCKKHNIDAWDFKKAKIVAPISRAECKYKKPLFYQDGIIVMARCYYQIHPKLIIHYSVYKKDNNQLCAEGKTEQLFLDENLNLLMEQPPLIKEFFDKMRYGNLK